MMSPIDPILTKVANTIRGLSVDAIDKANSGHPGLPLGCAELFAYLYGVGLNHSPDYPHWINRDRFILSAGHGSIGLYAALHLSGFDVSLSDLKSFRQYHAKTPGHPEYGYSHGIETTTGPLGQGIASGVGMALGMAMLRTRFQTALYSHLFDAKVFILAGDGCMMEGISSEASSFAGHLQLDNLILIYDSNDICLDGPTSECLSEKTALRYEAYGWFVQTIDGHSLSAIHTAVENARKSSKPALIIAKTIIGKGAPTREGTSDAHGKPLGESLSQALKNELGIPESPLFYVPTDVTYFFKERQRVQKSNYTHWNNHFESWAHDFPDAAAQYHQHINPTPSNLYQELKNVSISPNKATRVQSAECLRLLGRLVPNLIGGSADLSCSDNTYLTDYAALCAGDFSGRNIKYGVREFAMAGIASGLALTQRFRPYIGTFLMFSDYMRNAIRMSALMGIPVVYQFTHDSVFLGEDGPTHQPIEHLASLRAIPNLYVFRPGDETEVKAAWYHAMTTNSPTAIVLSRQAITSLESTCFDGALKGGYLLHDTPNAILTLFATGSECSLAVDVARGLLESGISTRVISMVCWEVFHEQPTAYQRAILGETSYNAAIEAAHSLGWAQFIGRDGLCISVDTFGISAPESAIRQHYGFTKDAIITRLLSWMTPGESDDSV